MFHSLGLKPVKIRQVKIRRTCLVFQRQGGLNFWISAEISVQLCSPNNIQYEYAKGSKRQVCRHSWLLHGTPQVLNWLLRFHYSFAYLLSVRLSICLLMY